MGAVAPSTMLQSIRKAMAYQHAFIDRGRDVRRHHHAVLKSLCLAEATLQAGIDLDRAIEAIKAVGSERANARFPNTDQAMCENHFHAPSNSRRSLEADENPMRARTNFLQGREDDVRRHR